MITNQQPKKSKFEFLHIVMYIPAPKINAEKAAKGMRMKIFVLRPMQDILLVPINFSHFANLNIDQSTYSN